MRYSQIIEAAKAAKLPPENVDEALWWVIRYVSGSLNDDEWDWGEPNKLNVDTAMEVVSRYIGNKKSVGVPLSRYLLLDKNTAQKLVKTKMLPAYGNGFQSFTTHGRKEAVEIGREIAFGRTKGMVEVVVTVVPPASDVLFGFEDVGRAAKKQLPGTDDLFNQWNDNWGHQGEVLVRIAAPLACEVKVIKAKGLKEEEDAPIEFRIEREPIWRDGAESKDECYFHAYDGDKYAASLHIAPSRDGRSFSAISVWVNPEYRRMGLATRLYNAAHEAGFQPITPDSNLKPDGVKFWDAHMRGKWKQGQPRPEMKWTPQ
jgi:GNAT superfamily N-acetyltransferase